MLKTYEVANAKSGHSFGFYAATDAADAIKACHMEAGYNDVRDFLEQTGTESSELVANLVNEAGELTFERFESSGQAEPTSRVLEGSSDHGYAEEWAEPGHIVVAGERRPCRAIYLFTADEIAEQAEDYPWDAEHCARILLTD